MASPYAAPSAFGVGRGRRKEPKGGAFRDGPATDFAITTVNVPDRLDMREVHDRSDEYESKRRFRIDLYYIRLWLKRALALGVIVVLAYFGWQAAGPLRDEISAERIGQRLSQATGTKVAVQSSDFHLQPSPRLSISGIDAGKFSIPEVSILLNWGEFWSAVRGGSWTWGEALVAPMKLSTEQAFALMQGATGISKGINQKISTIRFESIELTDSPWLPGRYEVVLRREASGGFGDALLSQVGGEGAMKAKFKPGPDDSVLFSLNANDWKPPFGPNVRWQEVIANGRILRTPNVVDISEYSVSGFYGSAKGMLVGASDVEGVVTGTSQVVNLDLEAVMRYVIGKPQGDAQKGADPTVPVLGTAALSGIVVGRGATLADAVRDSVLAGPMQVRWATLNGINLGYAATRPSPNGGTAGGSTRFTELDAAVVAGRSGLTLSEISAKAGALSTTGEVNIAPDLSVKGALRVDLGATRVQAPINVRVRGTAAAPQFGR